jgi:hypothetical protein
LGAVAVRVVGVVGPLKGTDPFIGFLPLPCRVMARSVAVTSRLWLL